MRFVGAQQNSFVAGEFSEKLYHRSDLKAYQNGAKQLENMIVLRQGGATRRQGTIHVSNTVNPSLASRLVAFRRSLGVNFVLEFGNVYVRFYRNHALIPSYSLATPWTAAQIDDLRFAQSGDVLYITHPLTKPYKLSHYGDANWTLNPIAQKGGPFLPQNIVKTTKITASAATGNITLTATADTFLSTDVGGIWKLKYQDISGIGKWAGATGYSVGHIVQSRGMFYQAVATNEQSGTVAPEHTEGTEWDGGTGGQAAGTQWLYLHSGYANVTITAWISPTVAQATVETDMRLPADVVATGTYRWHKAAWSPGEGWPTSVGFFQERLVFGKLNAIDMSTINDFENLSPTDKSGTVTFDAAVRFVISDPKVDAMLWIAPSLDVALIGTSGAEYSFGSQTTSEPFGPDNVACLPQSAHGSVPFLQPERIDDAVLFASRGGRRLYEMTAAESGIGRYQSRELSVLADHLLTDSVFEAAYCENPHGSYWMITETGALIGMTYEKAQDVVAWHHHPLGGVDVFVESICAIPSVDGTYDELWLQVARTINGGTVRSIEYLSQPWDDVAEMADACFTDNSVIYDYPDDDTQVVAAIHLEGETVHILADGMDVGTQIVTGGQITLATAATKVCVGLPYRSRAETLTPDPGSEVGSSMGKRQRVVRAYVHFNRTAHCKLGRGPDGPLDPVTLMRGDQLLDEPTALFSGIREVIFSDGYSDEPTVVIEQDRPLPLEVYGIAWDMMVAAR